MDKKGCLVDSPSIVEPWSSKRTVTREVHAAWTSVKAKIQLTDAGDRGK
jgi:hypothetical protein